jgi:hypothetical protein
MYINIIDGHGPSAKRSNHTIIAMLTSSITTARPTSRSSSQMSFIDATHRTNRYNINMPLIHFMVVTSYRKTVSMATRLGLRRQRGGGHVHPCDQCLQRPRLCNLIQQSVVNSPVMGDAKIEVFLAADDSSRALKAAPSL